jgi:hypothetical protein
MDHVDVGAFLLLCVVVGLKEVLQEEGCSEVNITIVIYLLSALNKIMKMNTIKR